jgi:hypothetical protein
MSIKSIEGTIGKAVKLYIGELLKPTFTINSGGNIDYEISPGLNNNPHHIRGTLNINDQTGTLSYLNSTFYFKFSKYGRITDLGNPR